MGSSRSVMEEDAEKCCPVCLDSLPAEKCTLECGHDFHSECIIRWFRREGSAGACPVCRDTNGTQEGEATTGEESDESEESEESSIYSDEFHEHDEALEMRRRCLGSRMRQASRQDAPAALRRVRNRILKQRALVRECRRRLRLFVMEPHYRALTRGATKLRRSLDAASAKLLDQEVQLCAPL